MNQWKNIYFIGILVVTLFVVGIYLSNEREHQKEMEKIRRLEKLANDRKMKLNRIRNQYTSCPIKNLDTPRDCYVGSGYRCSWCEEGEFCVKK